MTGSWARAWERGYNSHTVVVSENEAELQPNRRECKLDFTCMIVFVSECPADELHSEYMAGAGPLTAVVSPSQGL